MASPSMKWVVTYEVLYKSVPYPQKFTETVYSHPLRYIDDMLTERDVYSVCLIFAMQYDENDGDIGKLRHIP